MKQKKIGTTLYVFDTTAYQITEDTDAAVIKIQLECIPAFEVLNESLKDKFEPINYKLYCVKHPEWADYLDDYTVSVSVTGNGAVSASPTSGDEGEEITLTVTPESGYEINTLAAASGGTAITITDNKFTMPAGNVTVTATFQGQEFDITCAEAQYGTVSAPSTARLGDTVTITTTPDTNYKLDTLIAMCGDVPVTITDSTFTMPAGDVTITATFAQDVPYEQQYFTLEAVENGGILKIDASKIQGDVYVSEDKGQTWDLLDGDKTYLHILIGETYSIKHVGNSFSLYDGSSSVESPFYINEPYFKVYGNVMSLIYGDNFIGQTSFPANSTGNLAGLFYRETICDASNLILPATSVPNWCYAWMFCDSSLTGTAPKLPAINIGASAYESMFGSTTITESVMLASNLFIDSQPTSTDIYKYISTVGTLYVNPNLSSDEKSNFSNLIKPANWDMEDYEEVNSNAN